MTDYTLISPSGFEGEAGGVASVAPQGAERPGDQLGARVVDVPQVNVLVGDLHHALPVDVQVRAGQEEHVEALCGGEKKQVQCQVFPNLLQSTRYNESNDHPFMII